MKEINDEVFGRMTYDYQWERPLKVTLWGRSCDLVLTVESETDDDESISDVQKDAYKSFTLQHVALESEMLKQLVRYCRDDLGVSGCSEGDVLAHSTPKALFFPLSGEWAIMLDSDYDEEGGLAAVVRAGLVEVGSQDIVL